MRRSCWCGSRRGRRPPRSSTRPSPRGPPCNRKRNESRSSHS
jgi:hypothetical protein